MAGRTKKQKIASAIFVILFFSMVACGVVAYTYDSFTTVETKPGQTTRVEDDDTGISLIEVSKRGSRVLAISGNDNARSPMFAVSADVV